MFVIKKVNLDSGTLCLVLGFLHGSYSNCSFSRVNVIRDLDDHFVSCHNCCLGDEVNLDSNLDLFDNQIFHSSPCDWLVLVS